MINVFRYITICHCGYSFQHIKS